MSSDIKTAVYEKLGQVALALGSPTRLRLIQILAQSPRTVEDLAHESGQSVANTSQHLQRMAKEGLVTCTKSGVSRIYQISSPKVLQIWETLIEFAHETFPQLNEAENQLTDAALRAGTPIEQITQDLSSRRAILLDVRDEMETAATPVGEAVAIPLERLKAEMKKLSKQKTIYVFCRGRYCDLASDAVRALRSAGFKAFRLRESSFKLRQVLPPTPDKKK